MILCMMRIPPALEGHGGSQRAWRLLQALADLAPVHFVLISRKADKDAANVSLEPVRAIAETVTSIDIPEWQPAKQNWFGRVSRVHTGWVDLLGMHSHEAPAISRGGLQRIAEQLPVRSVDTVFAGRLPSAVIIDALIRRGLFRAGRKLVDLDDIMSNFRRRQLTSPRGLKGKQTRLLAHIDVALIRRAERAIATTWDAVSVCTDDDVAALRAAYPTSRVVKVPNVIERPPLAPRPPAADTRLLFVGNLEFTPNVHGLQVFVDEAWPVIRKACPGVTLDVVGMFPDDRVRQICTLEGISLHPNVPSLEPYYARCDVVIAPILFGGGTRIKILEAMAYGRPVVSTRLGAEGLHMETNRHAILVNSMQAFAEGVIRLCGDRELRERMVRDARELQQSRFGYPALADAVREMVSGPADPSSGGGSRTAAGDVKELSADFAG